MSLENFFIITDLIFLSGNIIGYLAVAFNPNLKYRRLFVASQHIVFLIDGIEFKPFFNPHRPKEIKSEPSSKNE